MKANRATRFGLAIAAVLLAAPLLAQGPGGMGMRPGGGGPGFGMHRPPMERAFGALGDMGRWWNNPRIVAELKLTDDQRKAMDAILLAHRERLVDLRASLEKAELEMQPLLSADQPDETAVLAQIDKVAQARAELEKANARFLLDIRAKLTPDQWKQLQADHTSRRAVGGMRGEQRRNWRPGGQRQPNWRPRGPNGQNPQPAPQAPPAPPQGGAAPGTGTEQ